MTDFNAIHGQLSQWSRAIAGWTDEEIGFVESEVLQNGEHCQYCNRQGADESEAELTQVIAWNALPEVLVRQFGYQRALQLSDTLYRLSERMDMPGPYFAGKPWQDRLYRPHDEYCEWRIVRDRDGRIRRVIFTSEPPEYWQALHGDTVPVAARQGGHRFTGDRSLLMELYRHYVSPHVEYDDLVAQDDMVDHSDPEDPRVIIPKGAYNPWNRWNTVDGIMHLCHPSNSIRGEIRVAVNASVLRRWSGRLVTDPDMLVCCTGNGNPMRNSDVAITSTVNALARQGARLTLRNPVGVYMRDIDLAGIAKPDGTPVERDYFRVERGSAEEQMIERAVFEVPEGEGFTVSDLTIGGVPIRRGGQLAERITVALYAVAGGLGHFDNTPVTCTRRCCQGKDNPLYLRVTPHNAPCGDGMTPAFDHAVDR